MVQEYFEKLPVPHVSGPLGEYLSPELLYSTAGFTQKGITVASGFGVIPIGTIMARDPVTKRYVPWMATASEGFVAYDPGDPDADPPVPPTPQEGIPASPVEAAAGLLRRSIQTDPAGSIEQVTNLVIQGICKLSMVKGLPTDEGARTDLLTAMNATIDPARDTFKF